MSDVTVIETPEETTEEPPVVVVVSQVVETPEPEPVIEPVVEPVVEQEETVDLNAAYFDLAGRMTIAEANINTLMNPIIEPEQEIIPEPTEPVEDKPPKSRGGSNGNGNKKRRGLADRYYGR